MFHPETQKELVKSHHQDIFKESEGPRLRNIGKTRYRSRPSLLKRIIIRFGKFLTRSEEDLISTEISQRSDILIQDHEV